MVKPTRHRSIMKYLEATVVGVDVGGSTKGFHAVLLREGRFTAKHFKEAVELASWCQAQSARVIAIDAPCSWAVAGGSRLAERSLAINGRIIQCFKTPTRAAAKGRAFFGWVFNGEKLYRALCRSYRLYVGAKHRRGIVLETFPHAVVCALKGQVVSARPKARTRREVLRKHGYDDQALSNIDFVDAALCALTAESYRLGRFGRFGNKSEGFIVVPSAAVVTKPQIDLGLSAL